ncbi:MAG: cytochrome c biogenesis heme-transporting ATPase CcmA [Proteobacteria bacterium]|nr:cytochrome c biogenesis heme-transporting ATPase CcmA [Pseudomonadota bacterium]
MMERQTAQDDHTEDAGLSQLEVSGLECIRQDIILFQDISFKLQSGDLLQVDGLNGSGKSSLLRILAGLMQQNAGKISWQRKEISTCRYEYQQELSYIGHLNGVKDALTALENLRVMVALAGSKPEFPLSKALDQIELVGMESIPLSRMSAGQKRRVALARLFITKAAIWLLDEPFTSLDASGKLVIERLIAEHCACGGIIIFSTHQPMEIKDCSIMHIHLGKK